MIQTAEMHGASSDDRADFAFAGAVVAALGLLVLAHRAFPHLVSVLLFSALFSFAVLPLVDRLARRMPRTLAVLLVGLCGAGVVAAAGFLLVQITLRELQHVPEVLARTSEGLQREWASLRESIPAGVAQRIEAYAQALAQGALAPPDVPTLSTWGKQAGSGIATVASSVLFVPIVVFVMLRRYHRLSRTVIGLVPSRWRAKFQQRFAELDAVLAGFVRGQLLVALAMAACYSVAFVVIGLPMAILLGVIAGFAELVPYLGGTIALLLGALLALAVGEPLDVLWVALTFVVVQSVQGALLSPWIVGRRARVGPVGVIVALAIGGGVFGFVGLLFAVPIAAVLKVAAAAAAQGYRHTRFYLTSG